MKRFQTISPIMLLTGILLMASSCERDCGNINCEQDQFLKIILVDTGQNKIIHENNSQVQNGGLKVLAPARSDTLKGELNYREGAYTVETMRDLGKYTVIVGNETNVDLLVYQQYVPSEYECCPGYWRIDSVYARGEKLPTDQMTKGYLLAVD